MKTEESLIAALKSRMWNSKKMIGLSLRRFEPFRLSFVVIIVIIVLFIIIGA